MKNIETKIKEIIAHVLEVSVDYIEDDTEIGDISKWDSLHHIQIISDIEKEYDFHFTPEEIMKMGCVEDIIRVAKTKADLMLDI